MLPEWYDRTDRDPNENLKRAIEMGLNPWPATDPRHWELRRMRRSQE